MFAIVGRLVAVLILSSFTVVLGQLPAHACSCKSASTQVHTKNATDVFTGTLLDVQSQRKENGQRGARYTYDIEVERVYKGTISTAKIEVTSGASSTCGLGQLETDRRYVFFARTTSGELRADLCSGTARAKVALVKKIENLLGAGRPPVPEQPEEAVFTRVSDAEPTPLTRLAAPGLALSLAGLLGLILARRLGRNG